MVDSNAAAVSELEDPLQRALGLENWICAQAVPLIGCVTLQNPPQGLSHLTTVFIYSGFCD